jgi:hypothetical protein
VQSGERNFVLGQLLAQSMYDRTYAVGFDWPMSARCDGGDLLAGETAPGNQPHQDLNLVSVES